MWSVLSLQNIPWDHQMDIFQLEGMFFLVPENDGALWDCKHCNLFQPYLNQKALSKLFNKLQASLWVSKNLGSLPNKRDTNLSSCLCVENWTVFSWIPIFLWNFSVEIIISQFPLSRSSFKKSSSVSLGLGSSYSVAHWIWDQHWVIWEHLEQNVDNYNRYCCMSFWDSI